MKLRCDYFQKELESLRRGVEEMRFYLDEYAKTGDPALEKSMQRVMDEHEMFAGYLKEGLEKMPYEEAKELFSDDQFFGYEEAMAVFHADVPPIDDIPFTRQELLEAKIAGRCLIYYPESANEGEDQIDIQKVIKGVEDYVKKNPGGMLSHVESLDLELLWNSYLAVWRDLNRQDLRPSRIPWKLVDLKTLQRAANPKGFLQQLESMPDFAGTHQAEIPSIFETIYNMLVSKRIFEWMKKQNNILPQSDSLIRGVRDPEAEIYHFSVQLDGAGGTEVRLDHRSLRVAVLAGDISTYLEYGGQVE